MKKFLLFFLFANVLVALSNLQVVLHLLNKTSGYTYTLVHRENRDDYYTYLSDITQGKYGSWLKHDVYTTEKTAPSFFHVYYIFAGKLAQVAHTSPHITYHVVRILSVELFLLGVFLVCQTFTKKHVLLASMTSLVLTIPPTALYFQYIDQTTYPTNYPKFILFDALERIYMPAHYMFTEAALLISIVLLFHYLDKRRFHWIVASAIVFLIGAISFPPIIVPFAPSLLFATFVYCLQYVYSRRTLATPKYYIIASFVMSSISFLTIKLLSFQASLGFPWSGYQAIEIHRWNILPQFSTQLIISFTIPISIATIALAINRRKLDFKKVFIFAWCFIPFVFLPFTDILGIPKIRLILASSFIPFSLAVVYILDRLKNRYGKVFFMSALFLFSLISILNYAKIRFTSITYFHTHKNMAANPFLIPTELYDGLMFMEKNLPKSSHILSAKDSGVMIPAYAPVISFNGYFLQTYQFGLKSLYTDHFLTGLMDKKTAEKFLKSNRIHYVLYGPFEKRIGRTEVLTYDFLTKVYDRDDVVIYKVKTK